jgi:hypothetical protein
MNKHMNIFNNHWGISPNRDSNGDGIVTEREQGYIYKFAGMTSSRSYLPLFYNSLDIFKTLMIIICIAAGALGIYSVFGCKSRYLQYTTPFQAQLVLFFVFYINVFIVSAETYQKHARYSYATSTVSSGIYAFICLMLFNIIAKLGDSWAFYRVPFYPGPLTWWGVVMFASAFIFSLDNARLYWKDIAKHDTVHKNETFFYNAEVLVLVIVTLTVIGRFGLETVNEISRLGNKFNFIKFFFGTDSTNKVILPDFSKIETENKGHCKFEIFKKYDIELKNGYKNSPWTKFLKFTGIEN